MPRDFAVFLGEMIRNPDDVRAIAPSSSAMARVMAAGLEDIDGPIAEIGPGTGVFTRAILERGVAPERLTLFELNARFCDDLRSKFPGVQVLNRSATEIHHVLSPNVGAVLSGVPLLNRPTLQDGILASVFASLRPGGVFTQFTYAFSSPIEPDMQRQHGITARKKGTIWANLPPARVFEYTRQPI